MSALWICSSFFFNATATTEIYTLSLHDALPISSLESLVGIRFLEDCLGYLPMALAKDADRPNRNNRGPLAKMQRSIPTTRLRDRKSTRLNSSHPSISYAVFCLKKKKTILRYSMS